MSLGVSEVLFLLVWMCANVLQWLLEVGSRNWIDRQESLIIRISSVCYASTRESSMDQLCDSELETTAQCGIVCTVEAGKVEWI
jgi:hypothetical protein